MANGSENAYYTLFERHWEQLYSNAVHILHNREIAKDVVQEVFLSFWENRGNQPIQNVVGYLNRAAKFKALNEIRDDKANLYEDVEKASELPEGDHNPLDAEELQEQIAEVIQELPERCREVFVLSREEHLTNKEIADRLDLSQRTVETHISNALKHLRKKLPEQLPLLVISAFLG